MKTRITEVFDIRYPIVQRGTHEVAHAEPACAVSNAGGLGADGMKMATRLIVLQEAPVHGNAKRRLAAGLIHRVSTCRGLLDSLMAGAAALIGDRLVGMPEA